MTSFLEQIQANLRQLENRIKHMERRLSQLEHSINNTNANKKKEEEVVPKQQKNSNYFDIKRFEFNIGKYFLQIIGVGIFLVGMGFLLKFSIEKEWLSPMMRVLIGFIGATSAIFLGEYWRIHYKQWAAGCMAGGIVLFYFTFYAAYNLYQIFSLQQTFSGFIVTTIFAAILALWHNSFFIALFSVFGAYLTPIILRIEVFNPILLSSYILILAFCYVVLSYAKRWFLLSFISLAAGMLYFSYVLFLLFTIHQKLVFLGCFWVIYSFLPYVSTFLKTSKKGRFASLLLAISSIFVFFNLFYSLTYESSLEILVWPLSWLFQQASSKQILNYVSLIFFILNTSMLGCFYAWNRKKIYVLGTLYSLAVACGIGFISTLFSGYSTVAALACFALLLFGLSFVCSQVLMRLYPYFIWVFCGWRLSTLLYNQMRPETIIFNEITIILAIMSVVFVSAYWLSIYYKNQLHKYEWLLPTIFEGIIIVLPLYWFHTKVWQFPYHILGFICYGLVLFIYGLLKNEKLIRQYAYASWIFSVVYFLFHYFFKNLLNPYWTIWLNILFLHFIVLFVTGWLLVYYWPEHLEKREQKVLQNALDFGLILSILGWIRSNIILYFDELKMQGAFFMKQLVGYSMKNDSLVRQPFTNIVLALFYALYAVLLILLGLMSKKRFVRYFGLVLVGLAVLKLWFIIMRMSDTISRIVAFLIIGALFISASFLYQKMSKKIE